MRSSYCGDIQLRWVNTSTNLKLEAQRNGKSRYTSVDDGRPSSLKFEPSRRLNLKTLLEPWMSGHHRLSSFQACLLNTWVELLLHLRTTTAYLKSPPWFYCTLEKLLGSNAGAILQLIDSAGASELVVW